MFKLLPDEILLNGVGKHQQNGTVILDAGNFDQLFAGSFEDIFERTEVENEGFSQRFDIALRNGVSQEQFQNFVRSESGKSGIDKSFSQPLPVSGVFM